MYRTGHLGATLAVYTPVGVGAILAGFAELAVLGGVVAVSLASLPDRDLQLPLVSHRGITHTVWFALAVGAVLAGVGWLAAAPLGVVVRPDLAATVGLDASADLLGRLLVAGFGFLVGWVAVGSHVLADALTPMGVTPFTPVSDETYSANLVTADNAIANYLLLALGVGVAVTGLLLSARLI